MFGGKDENCGNMDHGRRRSLKITRSIRLTSWDTGLFLFRLVLDVLLMEESVVRVAVPTPPTVFPLTLVPAPPTSLCSVPGLWNEIYRCCVRTMLPEPYSSFLFFLFPLFFDMLYDNEVAQFVHIDSRMNFEIFLKKFYPRLFCIASLEKEFDLYQQTLVIVTWNKLQA